MNRASAPTVLPIEKISLPEVRQIILDNGVPVYIINAGEQEVVKLELLFKAGKWYEEKNLLADFTNRMLREGTATHTAKQIADAFDYYGASVNYGAAFETAGATFYSLTKNAEELFPLLFEIFTEPSFPQHELETILNNRRQKLSLNLKKNDFLANRSFVGALFGAKHPYGRVTEFENFDNISVAYLNSFFKKYYNAANLTILISGKFSDALIKKVNSIFGSKTWLGEKPSEIISHRVESSSQLIHHTEKEKSVQSAIAIGNISINKHHPDFIKLTVLNTVLGGYFGSRLMTNIREEKGYTYGIHSSFVSYPHAGFFEISSDVGKDVRQKTFDEIEKEINLLRTELIGEEELLTVKNYMSGKILRGVDGALKFSEALKSLILFNQDVSYLHHLLKTVRETNSEELLQLANKYLDYGKMYRISVG